MKNLTKASIALMLMAVMVFAAGCFKDKKPEVTTSEVQNITGSTALCGGVVTSSDADGAIIERGVCWGSQPNPETSGDHVVAEGNGTGSFSCVITGLESNTTYYVRAYAINSVGVGYGDNVSFSTEKEKIPEVTTSEVQDITGSTALCGGVVTSSEADGAIIERGVCWGSQPNPETSGDHVVAEGNGTGSFTCMITGLESRTTYHVRAYAINSVGVGYGDDLIFTTDACDYVDLGLPSGTLWATQNVEGYFAWGETEPKTFYGWVNYKFCVDGNYQAMTKYCNDTLCGNNGFMDHVITLFPEDDAATVNWGENWRTPTKEEWLELFDNTEFSWTEDGVPGWRCTATNGNSIFLPALGNYQNDEPVGYGNDGYYWSSSLYETWAHSAWRINIRSFPHHLGFFQRSWGLSVRPVRSTAK